MEVAGLKAYEVPQMCVRLGLQERVEEADSQEAFSSKRIYIKSRLAGKGESELLNIAEKVIQELGSEPLAEVIAKLTQKSEHLVSDIVRIDVLKSLNTQENLFGDLDVLDSLAEIFGETKIKDDPLGFLKTNSLQGKIFQRYIRNDDWTHAELLTQCGAITCSQKCFFKLLEKLLHPIVRRDKSQAELAITLNQILKKDGFSVRPVTTQSGYQIYGVMRVNSGVDGGMKNIIFASTGEKPEIIIRDAVNNDIEITKHADKVLIFDKSLPSNGSLLWNDLLGWWMDKHNFSDELSAKNSLYGRLLQSVKSTKSLGELAVFYAYYAIYGKKLGSSLPALLPQVYLHYDPYTQRQRGDEKILMRQRMDFLLMLENGSRIVIEVDGQHHYADQSSADHQKYIASPKKYADMVSEDRWLRSAGYEIYRFGGYEFMGASIDPKNNDARIEKMINYFFDKLFRRHGVM